MDSPSSRSGSTSPFPIIINSETLSGDTSTLRCEHCDKLKLTIRDAFKQRTLCVGRQGSKTQCCSKNKLAVDYSHYRQKLHWSYECKYCEYRSFYADEIDRHLTTAHSLARSDQLETTPESPRVNQSLLSLVDLNTPTTDSRETKDSVWKVLATKSLAFDENVVTSSSTTVDELTNNQTLSDPLPSTNDLETKQVDTTMIDAAKPVKRTDETKTPSRKKNKRTQPAKKRKSKKSVDQPDQKAHSKSTKTRTHTSGNRKNTPSNCLPDVTASVTIHTNHKDISSPGSHGNSSVQTSHTPEEEKSKKLAAAKLALLSPIQTFNLSQFSDVLGLKQIANSNDLGKSQRNACNRLKLGSKKPSSQYKAKRSNGDVIGSAPLAKFPKVGEPSEICTRVDASVKDTTLAASSALPVPSSALPVTTSALPVTTAVPPVTTAVPPVTTAVPPASTTAVPPASTTALTKSVTAILLPKTCITQTVSTLSVDVLTLPCFNGSLIPTFGKRTKGPILQEVTLTSSNTNDSGDPIKLSFTTRRRSSADSASGHLNDAASNLADVQFHSPPNSDHLYSKVSPPKNSLQAENQSSDDQKKQMANRKVKLSGFLEPKLTLVPVENILGKDLLRDKFSRLDSTKNKGEKRRLVWTARKSTGARNRKKSRKIVSIGSMPAPVQPASNVSHSRGSMLPPTTIMSPLHISTDCSSSMTSISPTKNLADKEISESSADECADPWPSPRDQEFSQGTTSSKSNEKLIRNDSITSLSSSTPRRHMSTPLLTIGRRLATPESFSLSASSSTTSGKVSGRYPLSKRISKETLLFALSSFCLPDIAKICPINKSSPVRSPIADCSINRGHSTATFVHDRRVKSIKHQCRPALELNPEISLSTSAIDDDDVAVSNVWPGPSSSDEEKELVTASSSEEVIQLPALQTMAVTATVP